jgi:hypothetical protein
LYKAGGSLKREKQAESLLWSGQVNEVINLFNNLKTKEFKTFCNYLSTHRSRIVNYRYYKEESGASHFCSPPLEIGVRSQESGARRKEEEGRRKEPEEVFLQI